MLMNICVAIGLLGLIGVLWREGHRMGAVWFAAFVLFAYRVACVLTASGRARSIEIQNVKVSAVILVAVTVYALAREFDRKG
jgi:hypothetical protein